MPRWRQLLCAARWFPSLEKGSIVTTKAVPITRFPEWRALAAHYEDLRTVHLRELFATDPTRGERMTAEAAGVYFDYSKNRVTDETLRLLLDVATGAQPPERMRGDVRGDKNN